MIKVEWISFKCGASFFCYILGLSLVEQLLPVHGIQHHGDALSWANVTIKFYNSK